MRFLVVLLCAITLVASSQAKQDPAVEARKQFIHNWTMQAEQSGYPCSRWITGQSPSLAGKHKDKFVLLIINAAVSEIMSLEQSCVETRKGEMRLLGFTAIEIRSDAYSETFPDGIWHVPMN